MRLTVLAMSMTGMTISGAMSASMDGGASGVMLLICFLFMCLALTISELGR